jgi:hypothetical protein
LSINFEFVSFCRKKDDDGKPRNTPKDERKGTKSCEAKNCPSAKPECFARSVAGYVPFIQIGVGLSLIVSSDFHRNSQI